MDRTVHITIKSLAERWGHPDLHRFRKASARKQLCKALLPDAYDDSKCSEASALFFREGAGDDTTALNESTLRMLVSGNRRSLSRGIDRPGSITFTEDLIRRLNSDSVIRFRDGSRSGTRKNLLEKLYRLVRTTEPQLDRSSPLFLDHPLRPDFPGGPGAKAYARLENLRTELLEEGGLRAVTWAVLITVLAGWVQWRIAELQWLWDRTLLEAYLALPTEEPEKHGFDFHRPFDRESYLHDYHVYLYRATTRDLYPMGTLSLGSQVRLELRYELMDRPGSLEGQWRFTGTPMLSPRDSMVYALMADERSGAMAFLCFHFTDFRSGDMFFRIGFLTNAHPLTQAPQVRKLVISRRELSPEQLSLARGALCLPEDITLTPAQLEAFQDTYSREPWMLKFREQILPFIRLHESQTYRLGASELMEYTAGGLDPMDRLRITMLLKDCSTQTEDDGRLFARCQEPQDLHKLMK